MPVEIYENLSREELIQCLVALEREKQQSLLEYKEQARLQNDYQTQERLAILKAAVNIGDSLIWEYDVIKDEIHVDYELNVFSEESPSRLKIEPFRKREDFLNTIYPDDRQNVYYDHFMRLIKGEIPSYSIQYRRLFEDQVIWVKANVQPYKYNQDGTPSHVVYYLSDISEKKQLLNKLYKLEDKYRKIIKAIPDVILTLNSEAKILDYFAGSGESRMHEPEYLEGRTVEDVFPADVAASLRTAILNTIETQKEQNLYNHVFFNGREKCIYNRIIPFEENEVIVIGRDISDFLRNKERVNFLSDLMRVIMENIPIMIVVKEVDKDFRYLYFNPAAERFMGIKLGAALGKSDFELFEEGQLAEHIREYDLETVAKGQSVQYAIDYNTFDGEQKKVNAIRLIVNNISEKQSPLLVAMIWDITKDIDNEVELFKARESDKLKSAFLANMSHEIRTPLNAIVGFSTLLVEAEGEAERDEFISIINKNNELLLQLIDDILDISKIEADMLEYRYADVDLKRVCTDLYLVHSLKNKPGVKMVFNLEHPTVILYTDERRLKQVISNFLTNAIKFTDQGTITIAYEVGDNGVYLSVEDTGVGISQEKQASIFSRFVKLDNYRQGTGLGLAISKMLIEHLGGTIGVEAEEGKGSTFWFRIPLRQPDSE